MSFHESTNPMFNCAFDLTTLSKGKKDFVKDRMTHYWKARIPGGEKYIRKAAVNYYDKFRTVVNIIKNQFGDSIYYSPDEDVFTRKVTEICNGLGFQDLEPFVKDKKVLYHAIIIAHRELIQQKRKDPTEDEIDQILGEFNPKELTYIEFKEATLAYFGNDYEGCIDTAWKQEEPLDTVAVTNHLIENYVDMRIHDDPIDLDNDLKAKDVHSSLIEIYGPELDRYTFDNCAYDAWEQAFKEFTEENEAGATCLDDLNPNVKLNIDSSHIVDAMSYPLIYTHLEHPMSFTPVAPTPNRAPAHEVKEFVYGVEAVYVNDEQLIAYIRNLEADIAQLKSIETKSEAIKKKIESLVADKDAIVELLDARVE